MKMLLLAKIVVTCPLSGETVDAKEKCAICKNYKHISFKGLQPYIKCDYQMEPEPKPEAEPNGIDGLKRW